MYLIPTKMLTAHRLPTRQLLQTSPTLDRLFSPLCTAIKRADLRAFNAALEAGEDEFVKRRIYLTLERGRDILLRNLFRKVFIAGEVEDAKVDGGGVGAVAKRTRIPVREIAAALRMAGATEIDDGEGGVDTDEVECLVANAIYKVRPTYRCAALPCQAPIRHPSPGLELAVADDILRAEPHERLHSPRPGHRRAQQDRRLPGHWCLNGVIPATLLRVCWLLCFIYWLGAAITVSTHLAVHDGGMNRALCTTANRVLVSIARTPLRDEPGLLHPWMCACGGCV